MSYRLIRVMDGEVSNIVRDPEGFAKQLMLKSWDNRHGHRCNAQLLVSNGKDVGEIIYRHDSVYTGVPEKDPVLCGVIVAGTDGSLVSLAVDVKPGANTLDVIRTLVGEWGYKLTKSR